MVKRRLHGGHPNHNALHPYPMVLPKQTGVAVDVAQTDKNSTNLARRGPKIWECLRGRRRQRPLCMGLSDNRKNDDGPASENIFRIVSFDFPTVYVLCDGIRVRCATWTVQTPLPAWMFAPGTRRSFPKSTISPTATTRYEQKPAGLRYFVGMYDGEPRYILCVSLIFHEVHETHRLRD